MKIRYRVGIEIVIEGKNEEEIENKFENIDLGALDHEQKETNIFLWNFANIDERNYVNKNGTVGEEL